MNTLSYILLCMLVRKPCTGYELKQYLSLFWEAHHSQIYTSLAKLLTDEYVSVENDQHHSQKKIYHLTEKGEEIVNIWIQEETKDPSQKDEFLAKMYVASILDKDTVKGLLFERKQHHLKILKQNQQKQEQIDLLKDPVEQKKNFGRFLVVQRKIRMCEEELRWCHWAEEQVEQFNKFER
ncbi:PadR family transcriptional regulator [Candidatus Enterococcus mansonii]|uniref:Transcription regulator PadR N-terminal domain-containing protein n=1 Tax=Candidatus Enterococcus mansonii TaxID=1834181 RepID=A0A242CKP3_9ENTE|nr:PadR family transcriptional regulator [Enterococcus sp. 4G2_DIV0659]OTO10678.1 hypothetical protein A5880_001362 [Enterococcus sp. 4G2_DIV0659]